MRVLIIEDEVLAQKEFIGLLEQLDQSIEVVDCLDSIASACTYLEDHQAAVDLIFMDIELSDGICFEIFDKVEVEVPVIFVTAYDEYAIRAFKVNSIDYLLKPVEIEALRQAIEKFQKQQDSRNTISLSDIQDLIKQQEKQPKRRFMIKVGDTYRNIATDDIAYFFIKDKYTYVMSVNGDSFILDYSLHELEKQLNPDHFYRVSRKYIVNIDAVKKASKYFNSRLKLTLTPTPEHDKILISRERVDGFLQWMGKD